MCGILGSLSADLPSRAAIMEALDLLYHRGPDDSGLFLDSRVFLAMRRLSIIDLETGHQPITTPDGQITAICNGEIYNYVELRNKLRSAGYHFRTSTDTEVIPFLYQEYGDTFPKHLRGMFAIALWDAGRQRLLLVRDRFGKKPLYYHINGQGNLLFSSELKALKPLSNIANTPWAISDQSIYNYLSLGVVPQPDTIYSGWHSLPAASTLIANDGRTTLRTYWSAKYRPKLNIPTKDLLPEVRRHIHDAVRVRLRSDVPLGVFLSGGVDSSIITYEAAQIVGPSLQSFTIAMGDPNLDESSLAASTAAALGIRNTVLPLSLNPLDELDFLINHFDQPFADSSAIPTLAVSRLARQHTKVVLSGDGGDEIFAGYRRHLAASLASNFSWIPRPALRLALDITRTFASTRRSRSGFLQRFLRGLVSESAERYLIWTNDLLLDSDKSPAWRASHCEPTEDLLRSHALSPSHSDLDSQLHTDCNFNLLSDLLVKMDMASMAASLEVRSPFLDHHLTDFVNRVPSHQKIKKLTSKYLLKAAYRNLVPGAVLSAPKRGFEIPLETWLNGPLFSLLNDSLRNSNAHILRYIDRSFLLSLLEGDSLQDRNRSYLLYALLVLELWLGRTN